MNKIQPTSTSDVVSFVQFIQNTKCENDKLQIYSVPDYILEYIIKLS